jgi:XFP-like protein
VRVSTADPLSPVDLDRMDAYWRAANYLSVGQIYLMDNPLLREPLRPEHVKPRPPTGGSPWSTRALPAPPWTLSWFGRWRQSGPGSAATGSIWSRRPVSRGRR